MAQLADGCDAAERKERRSGPRLPASKIFQGGLGGPRERGLSASERELERGIPRFRG